MVYTNPSRIHEPEVKITTIKELLFFTLRICNMLENKEIDEKSINKQLIIDNGNLVIESKWKSEVFPGFAKNLRLCVLGNCFIIMDEALDVILGPKPKEYSDNDIDSLRAIVYMLRCAVAHNPTAPVWNAKGIYNKNFYIRDIDFRLDTTKLDGKILDFRHHGGIAGVVILLDYTLNIIRSYGKK